MAVTITTQFFDGTSTWVDLSKIVYTSPNIPDGSAAGTRSHILPGELPLGLWYEDTSTMYRVANQQVPTIEDYTDDSYNTTASGFHAAISVVFEVTSGECYDCRLTCWDDVTHSSTNTNELVSDEHVKVSAVSYRAGGTKAAPSSFTEVHPPSYNLTIKGNTTVSGVDAYYGDFDMIYANPTTGKNGDFVIFKPWLTGIDSSVSYGVHDFVITFHYTYT